MPDHHLANGAGIVYEHMIVAEKILGRALLDGEVVHHKDRNRSNNAPDNLMVFQSQKDHSAYHNGCEIVLCGDVYISLPHKNSICPKCGCKKDNKAELCRSCYMKSLEDKLPPKEELEIAILSNSMVGVGRIYNVTDNAVRKWCKKYGLPSTSAEIKIYKEKQHHMAE